MKHIIVGSNRKGSNSRKVADLVAKLYSENGEDTEIIDVHDMPITQTEWGNYVGPFDDETQKAIDKINKSEGLIIVCPEYNGSMPGALKYFIDHWSYPESFESRPVCFIGLGGRFGGVRPVEHLQGVFGYRNSYIFPERIFLMNVWNLLDGDTLNDDVTLGLLKRQVLNFSKFVKGLQSQKLDANSLLESKQD